MHFTAAQRRLLGLAALAGFIGPNGLFLYVAMAHRDVLAQAMTNQVAQAFIAEALMLTVLGCWLINRKGPKSPGWVTFLAMSLIGSLSFSVPAYLWLLDREESRK